jgi:AAA+ superfamily predicted ATPase
MTNTDDKKLFSEATLLDFTNALTSAQHWGKERVHVADLFGGQRFVVTERVVVMYRHYLLQHVMSAYFEGLGFRQVDACNVTAGAVSAPVYEDYEVGYERKAKCYKSAYVTYENEAGEKLLVVVGRHGSDDCLYRVHASPDRPSVMSGWESFAKSRNFFRGAKISAGCQFLELSKVGWDDVIIPEGTKGLLRRLTQHSPELSELMRVNGLTTKQGVMLSGSPGNGKTSALKAITREATCSVIYALPRHLQYSENVRAVCEMARDLSPSILIIEDIDWIAEDRSSSSDAGKVIELMNQLDGIEEMDGVIVIATTNDVDKIERAIKNRPGRFDRVVRFDNPEEPERRRMIDRFCRDWTLEGVPVEKVVSLTGGLSGAHMYELCRTAARKSLEAGSYAPDTRRAVIRLRDFKQAVAEVKNKDYSTFLRAQGRPAGGGMGFLPTTGTDTWDTWDD